MTDDIILKKVRKLIAAYESGLLGGEKMPEDQNPGLDASSAENYLYFTLPMALNYQRNSYVLWECANKMYRDDSARHVFNPAAVCAMSEDDLRDILVRFKVALQPNKQPIIWRTLCGTVINLLDGDIRSLFTANNFSAARIKAYIQQNKKAFPYLGGNKICNYWLHVMEQYTSTRFTDRQAITVAPDTHIIQSSVRLGVITQEEALSGDVQAITAARWEDLLKHTQWVPIDLHTPLWLWSHGKFSAEI